MQKKNLVRTAEEEALWRFKTAQEVPVDSGFGMSVRRLLQACMRACPQAPDMNIRFMKAGKLDLDVAISEDMRLLHIHERWHSLNDAVEELGLCGKMAEDKVVMLTVKNLFANVLDQLPRETFQREGSARSSEWHIKQEMNRAEERLINRQEMEVCVTNMTDTKHPGFFVQWAVDPQPQDRNAMIEVQCHLASRCSDLRNDLLIAADGMYTSWHKAASLTLSRVWISNKTVECQLRDKKWHAFLKTVTRANRQLVGLARSIFRKDTTAWLV